MSEHITLTTEDQVEIAANYLHSDQSKIAILLHMMPATKESWEEFSQHLLEAGYGSIAIDQRGHGQSTMGGTLDYKQFTDAEHQARQLDVEAAIVFAKTQGFVEENMVVIGASIGANLAIQTLAIHPLISTAVALSPGLDYHGVQIEPALQQLHPGQQAILIASDDDVYSYQSAQTVHDKFKAQTQFITRSGLGHGTAMTDKDPGLVDEIISSLVR